MPEHRDYNGSGRWSAAEIREPYLRHASSLGVREPRSLNPRTHAEGDVVWTFPVMERVIEGIEEGDPACAEIGVQFIEDWQRQPFGSQLQAQTARALRHASLTTDQIARLRSKILQLLVSGDVPLEYREYAKLLRRIGVGEEWASLRASVDRSNPHVLRYVRYIEEHVRGAASNK